MTTVTLATNIPLHCIHHPQTPTGLRCIRCGQPVCARCVVHTPVGYQCKACNNGLLKVHETIRPVDYVLASMVIIILAGAGSLLSMINLGLTILGTPVAAHFMAEAVRRVIGHRRSRRLGSVVITAFVLGCLPIACLLLILSVHFLSVAGLLLYIGIGLRTLRAELHEDTILL